MYRVQIQLIISYHYARVMVLLAKLPLKLVREYAIFKIFLEEHAADPLAIACFTQHGSQTLFYALLKYAYNSHSTVSSGPEEAK